MGQGRSKISDEALMEKLTDIFRCNGYEGGNLALISKKTGLKKSSLYYRFPGGKDEMVEAVLNNANEHLSSYLLAPLSDSGSPKTRVRKMSLRLSEFYDGGRKPCLLASLSFMTSSRMIKNKLNTILSGWIDTFSNFAIEAGIPKRQARRRAQEAVIGIQGSLVFSRGAGDSQPFTEALGRLPQLLTEK